MILVTGNAPCSPCLHLCSEMCLVKNQTMQRSHFKFMIINLELALNPASNHTIFPESFYYPSLSGGISYLYLCPQTSNTYSPPIFILCWWLCFLFHWGNRMSQKRAPTNTHHLHQCPSPGLLYYGWSSAYISGSSSVFFVGFSSSLWPPKLGVFQNSVLGPLLFIFFTCLFGDFI